MIIEIIVHLHDHLRLGGRQHACHALPGWSVNAIPFNVKYGNKEQPPFSRLWIEACARLDASRLHKYGKELLARDARIPPLIPNCKRRSNWGSLFMNDLVFYL